VLRALLDVRYLPDMLILGVVLAIQAGGAMLLLWGSAALRSRLARRALVAGACISFGLLILGFLLRFMRVNRYFPAWWAGWGRGIILTWAFLSVLLIAVTIISRRWLQVQSKHNPGRRAFLRTSQMVLLATPPIVTGYGVFIQRLNISLREQDLTFPGLPKELDGLRIAQLTDIHLSPFLSERELARAVDMANETRPHLAFITGDLITAAHDPLDDCLRQLARLRAEGGVFGCLGNHEIYAGAEDYVEEHGARLGLRILRNHAERLQFGGAAINLAGVDYQPSRKPYLVGADRLVAPGDFNILLSHNPDVFPVAARQGYNLTIAGHTHGGQVRVEILRQDLNIARFFTPYFDGLYRRGDAAVFVSRGIGTIGLPARIGAPPEVNLLRLSRG